MHKFLLLTCLICFMSMVALADETVETCAGGGGTIVIGAVTKYKYCKSNNSMNWWNAVSWCDAQKKELFTLDDCARNVTTSYWHCPELVLGNRFEAWTYNFYGSTSSPQTHKIYTDTGTIRTGTDGINHRNHGGHAVCK